MLLRIRPFPTPLRFPQQKIQEENPISLSLAHFDEVCSWVLVFFFRRLPHSARAKPIMIRTSRVSLGFVCHKGDAWHLRRVRSLKLSEYWILVSYRIDSQSNWNAFRACGWSGPVRGFEGARRAWVWRREFVFRFKSLWETGLLDFLSFFFWWLTMPFCGEHTRRSIILSIFMLAFPCFGVAVEINTFNRFGGLFPSPWAVLIHEWVR